MGDFQGPTSLFTRGYFYAPESTTSRGIEHCKNIRCTQPISTYEYPILPHLAPSCPMLNIAQLNDYVAYVSHISCPSVFFVWYSHYVTSRNSSKNNDILDIPTILPVESHEK